MSESDSLALGFCPDCWHVRGFHRPEGGCTVPFRGGCKCTRAEADIVPDAPSVNPQ